MRSPFLTSLLFITLFAPFWNDVMGLGSVFLRGLFSRNEDDDDRPEWTFDTVKEGSGTGAAMAAAVRGNEEATVNGGAAPVASSTEASTSTSSSAAASAPAPAAVAVPAPAPAPVRTVSHYA